MDYLILTDIDKRAIVESRLKQYEGQHYEATLNLAAVNAVQGTLEEQQQLQALISSLESAIKQHRTLLDEPL